MSIEADYDEIWRLRGKLTEAHGSLGAGRQALADQAWLPSPAFGDRPGSAQCATAYRLLRLRAMHAALRMTAVLDADAAKMKRMYDTYIATDQEAADRIFAQAGNKLDVYSAHVHAGRGDYHDGFRAGEITTLGERVAEHEGAAVVGADLNADIDNRDNNEAASEAAIDAYSDDLGLVNVGTLPDGGTSNLGDGRAIDYVFSTPMEVSDPDRVHGEPSDHDGQAVNLTIDRW